MKIDSDLLEKIEKQYGESFYILDIKKFNNNFKDLTAALRKYYVNSTIAYSYKTNYIPLLCNNVNKMGGYAEVVSDMEAEIAIREKVPFKKIYYNGPYKRAETLCKLLSKGVHVNIDSRYDFDIIKTYADKNNEKVKIGIRCNFDIGDNKISRFGIDVLSEEFENIINEIMESDNIQIEGVHCHFATRDLRFWKKKVSGLLEIVKSKFRDDLQYVCFGGGIFGNMEEMLKKQFDTYIPSFNEYAEVIAGEMANVYGKKGSIELLIEPGSALSGDVLKFIAKVINIKQVRGKNIATLAGSVYNINPTLNGKNPPMEVLNMGEEQRNYKEMDFAGYTCIENDYLYKGYSGMCTEGDYVVFSNVGSYSIVLKPPFILPNVPILIISDKNIKVVKRQEKFDDLFGTYKFEFEDI